MNIPNDLKYTKDHEWAMDEDNIVRVGITDYAQHELGDIVFVDLLDEGAQLSKGDSFGSVESVKAVSDLYSPVSGTIIDVNEALKDTPELVNNDCYGQAWMVVIKLDEPAELEDLLDAEDYTEFVAEEAK